MTSPELAAAQRRFFDSGRTRSVAFREEQLRRLQAALRAEEEPLLAALKQDLNKSAGEAYMTELGIVHDELSCALGHLRRWARPKNVRLPLFQFPASGCILPEPYGTALIISPWNYPVQLTLNPLIAALAAGNCAVVKPSAYAPAVSAALARLLSAVFPAQYVAVVEGGRQENAALLEQKWDTIFFTGSVAVGRVVMEAASRHLTPVSLELGGKSPVSVDATANLQVAARRILWGKTINAGQTCVAPDYVLADNRVKPALLREMEKQLRFLWGRRPLEKEEYPRIVNEKHFERLVGLMAGEHAAVGGECDAAALRIAPTVLDRVTPASPVMQEEIFGPLLPVLGFDELDEAIRFVRERPRPLALYVFSEDAAAVRQVLGQLSFGGGCVNDTIMHLATHRLPFGGVGDSGMGRYHGKFGFDTFTHYKPVVSQSTHLDLPVRYPPYTPRLGLMKRFLK